MIISKEVSVVLNSANMSHFQSLGYIDLNRGAKLIVPIEHLTNSSHSIVKVKCDVCGEEKDLVYRYYTKSLKSNGFYCCSSKCGKIKSVQTNLLKYGDEKYNNRDKYKKTCFELYGYDNPSQIDEFKDKRKKTMLKNHGVEYYVLSKDFKGKSENTSMINYGTSHPMMSEKMKIHMESHYLKMGYNIENDDFELYKNKVYRLTKRVKQKLIESWNGLDYYDNEYIRDNFNLPYHDINYPTIDHKITIFEGFKNNVEAEVISDISNLCFTKRCINSRKYIKNEFSFIT